MCHFQAWFQGNWEDKLPRKPGISISGFYEKPVSMVTRTGTFLLFFENSTIK
jgi:hypothetical protein